MSDLTISIPPVSDSALAPIDTAPNVSNTFFLLDGHAIAYRAFFGMQGRRFATRQGVPTGAVYGFTRILMDVIRSYHPSLLAVCFDTKDPTHRHESFDAYQLGVHAV